MDLAAEGGRARPFVLGRHSALGLLFCVSLLNYLDRYVLGVLLPSIKADLRLSDTQLGFVTGAAFAIFFALSGIPIGMVSDRISRRTVIAAAVALWSAMTALCGVAQSFAQLAVARILLGVGEAGATPPSHSLLSDLFPAKERAFALSVFSMGLPVGIGLGFLGGAHVAALVGWRATLVIFGAPGLLLGAAVAVLLPNPPRGASDLRQREGMSARPLKEAMAVLIRRRSFVHLCLGSGFFTIVWLGFITWLPSFFTRSFGLSPREVGTGLAVVLASSQFIGLAAGGLLADRLGRRDARWPLWICAASSLLPLPFFAAALLYPHPYVAMAMLFPAFLLGLLQGGPAVATVQAVAGATMRGVTVAIYLVVVNFASGLGTQLIGLLSDRLRPALGAPALGTAMLGLAILFSLWSAFHFWRGSRFLKGDVASADAE